MTTKNKNSLFILLPVVLLALGIVVRLIYAGYFGSESYKNYDHYTVFQYTHDSIYHIEYIQSVAEHLSLPAVEKGLEYPQQPFYYILAGILYRFLNFLYFSEEEILTVIVWLSALFSIGTLVFAYLLSKKVTEQGWVQSFIVGLMAFTPAFIYQAGMIGNDPLCTFLSAGAFYFLVRYIQDEKIKYFITAVSLATLASFTKISSGTIFLMILFALIYKYFYKNQKQLLKMIFVVFAIGFMCLGVMLYRAYLPWSGKFRFVESYTYEHQKTEPGRLSYFLTFNYPKLAEEGQSFVFGNKDVARTLPTFLYGSFLFGEYSFTNITDNYPFIKALMQFIILTGLLFPIGIIANFFYVKKWTLIDYVSIFGIGINLITLISFLIKYSAVCNSDFRYFCPVFLGLLLVSAMGLSRLNESSKIKFILPAITLILISSEFCWVIERLAVRIFTQI